MTSLALPFFFSLKIALPERQLRLLKNGLNSQRNYWVRDFAIVDSVSSLKRESSHPAANVTDIVLSETEPLRLH